MGPKKTLVALLLRWQTKRLGVFRSTLSPEPDKRLGREVLKFV